MLFGWQVKENACVTNGHAQACADNFHSRHGTSFIRAMSVRLLRSSRQPINNFVPVERPLSPIIGVHWEGNQAAAEVDIDAEWPLGPLAAFIV